MLLFSRNTVPSRLSCFPDHKMAIEATSLTYAKNETTQKTPAIEEGVLCYTIET